jgi:hypothetical protein
MMISVQPTEANLLTACEECNLGKATRTVVLIES